MNRIVREHYPVSKLPEDIRKEFGLNDTVRITVEAEGPNRQEGRKAAVSALLRARHALTSVGDDSVARVSGLRDEWDARPAE